MSCCLKLASKYSVQKTTSGVLDLTKTLQWNLDIMKGQRASKKICSLNEVIEVLFHCTIADTDEECCPEDLLYRG